MMNALPDPRGSGHLLHLVAMVQGTYFAITGVWPIIDIDSFMDVTGPKTDLWLVRTVGALITVVGITLIIAARRRRVTPEIVVLAIGSALALAAVDVIYVSNGTIPPIYLLDAVAEIGLVVGWGVAGKGEKG